MLRSVLASLALASALPCLCGCETDSHAVCENVGDCEKGGDSVYIASCKHEANLLEANADSTGCGRKYNLYVSCQSNAFTCHGATASFPGCDDERLALDHCLDVANAATACAELTRRTSLCAANRDGGADAGVPVACTASRDCEARCFLNQVSDVCAPALDELSRFVACADACPP
jgi:hypothetical protein